MTRRRFPLLRPSDLFVAGLKSIISPGFQVRVSVSPVLISIDLFHNSFFYSPHPKATLSEGEGFGEL